MGYGGLSILIEVKDGSKPKSAQELTLDQKQFMDTWKGGVRLVNSMEAVAETVAMLRKWHAKLSQ